MNQVVYKYPMELGSGDTFGMFKGIISMPKSAQILKIAGQGDEICAWAVKPTPSEGDEEVVDEMTDVSFTVIYTGTEFDPEKHTMSFVDTVFVGDLVYHVFKDLTEQELMALHQYQAQQQLGK